jgi:hypothetical protein
MERHRRMTPEQLDALIEWERRTALPRWAAWLLLLFGFAGVVVSLVSAFGGGP